MACYKKHTVCTKFIGPFSHKK